MTGTEEPLTFYNVVEIIFEETVIWNIFTTELNRDCEIEQALLICLSFW